MAADLLHVFSFSQPYSFRSSVGTASLSTGQEYHRLLHTPPHCFLKQRAEVRLFVCMFQMWWSDATRSVWHFYGSNGFLFYCNTCQNVKKKSHRIWGKLAVLSYSMFLLRRCKICILKKMFFRKSTLLVSFLSSTNVILSLLYQLTYLQNCLNTSITNKT